MARVRATVADAAASVPRISGSTWRAQIVAIEAQLVGVASSSSTQRQPAAREPVLQLGPRVTDSSGRTSQPAAKAALAGMAASAREAGAAKQLQQHGLELVVLVVGGQQASPGASTRASGRVARRRARPPRASTPRVRGTLTRAHRQRHPQVARERAAVRAQAAGGCLQLVVDVDRAQRFGGAVQLRARAQQRGRIESAAEGDAQRDVGVAGQQCA